MGQWVIVRRLCRRVGLRAQAPHGVTLTYDVRRLRARAHDNVMLMGMRGAPTKFAARTEARGGGSQLAPTHLGKRGIILGSEAALGGRLLLRRARAA